MARIAGVDLPREKRVEIGLTYIFGIGRVTADKILKETGFAVLEAVRPVLEKMIPPKKANLIDANMKALAIGMAL